MQKRGKPELGRAPCQLSGGDRLAVLLEMPAAASVSAFDFPALGSETGPRPCGTALSRSRAFADATFDARRHQTPSRAPCAVVGTVGGTPDSMPKSAVLLAVLEGLAGPIL